MSENYTFSLSEIMKNEAEFTRTHAVIIALGIFAGHLIAVKLGIV